MQRSCSVCGRDFEAKRKDAITCSATCRSNRRNGKSAIGNVDTPLVKATRAELQAAGKLDTRLGQQALVLAAAMSAGAGAGPLSKELDRVMEAAIGFAPPRAPAAGASVQAGQGLGEAWKKVQTPGCVGPPTDTHRRPTENSAHDLSRRRP